MKNTFGRCIYGEDMLFTFCCDTSLINVGNKTKISKILKAKFSVSSVDLERILYYNIYLTKTQILLKGGH